MSAQVVGLWLGGAISVEAAERANTAIWCAAGNLPEGPVKTELFNLANAIRAQVQQHSDPSDGLI